MQLEGRPATRRVPAARLSDVPRHLREGEEGEEEERREDRGVARAHRRVEQQRDHARVAVPFVHGGEAELRTAALEHGAVVVGSRGANLREARSSEGQVLG